MQIDPARGWAHPMALLIAGLIAVLLISGHRWWQEVHNPSPPPPEDEGHDDDTSLDLDDDPDDTVVGYQEETRPDGTVFVRYVRGRDRRDYDDEPETRDRAADRLVNGGGRYIDWVNDLKNQFGCSTSTAKRTIANAQQRRGHRS